MKKRRWQKTVVILLCVIVSTALVFVLFAAVYGGYLLSLIGREDAVSTLSPDLTGPSLNEADVTSPLSEESLPKNTRQINILLIGQDRRPGESRQRSDAMILCCFDTRHKTVTMVSFLRDLYVQIPGYSANKLNAAYAWGGMSLLKKTLEKNFHVPVDACMEVDFGGFQKVIDLVGGVDIDLSREEAEHLNSTNGWSLQAGSNRLDGKKALAYARIRKLDSDFARTQRQRKVLTQLLRRCRKLSIPRLTALLNSVLPLITTDMGNTQILGYAAALFPMLSRADIRTLHIPPEGMYQDAWVDGQMVLMPDLSAIQALLNQKLMQ